MFSYEGDVYAWKRLDFYGEYLMSPHQASSPWDTPHKRAVCQRRCPVSKLTANDQPWDQHTCGIYAYWTFRQLVMSEALYVELSTWVFPSLTRCAVRIKVSGKVAVAPKGLRAQHAEIVEIITIDPGAGAILALRYAFPGVVVSQYDTWEIGEQRFEKETEQTVFEKLGVTYTPPCNPPTLTYVTQCFTQPPQESVITSWVGLSIGEVRRRWGWMWKLPPEIDMFVERKPFTYLQIHNDYVLQMNDKIHFLNVGMMVCGDRRVVRQNNQPLGETRIQKFRRLFGKK